MNKILVIAVHPDDETLGCGGTLLKHKAHNDTIHWLICTDLNPNHPYYKTRQEEIQKVSSLYHFDSIINLKLQTMKIDEYSMSELITKISHTINQIKPTHIYLPFKGDVHSDHRKIFEASYSCTKSFRYPFIKKIYMMETLSETEFSPIEGENFIPNTFVDISEYLEKKLDIMQIYTSELAKHPFPRSLENIKALATFRGATSGTFFAESFMLLKDIR
jgi:LmbE family N-acetylglucosaminyl deacetylase